MLSQFVSFKNLDGISKLLGMSTSLKKVCVCVGGYIRVLAVNIDSLFRVDMLLKIRNHIIVFQAVFNG